MVWIVGRFNRQELENASSAGFDTWRGAGAVAALFVLTTPTCGQGSRQVCTDPQHAQCFCSLPCVACGDKCDPKYVRTAYWREADDESGEDTDADTWGAVYFDLDALELVPGCWKPGAQEEEQEEDEQVSKSE